MMRMMRNERSSAVIRRLHTPRIFVGRVPLDSIQSRHAREVLRLPQGATVELFDNGGATATGTLEFVNDQETAVIVEHVIEPQTETRTQVTVASAVPKGERADWMVEKLSELGVAAFVPLAAERSVVLPEGKGKRERWIRIATESAKQSRRAGVMRIDPLKRVSDLLAGNPHGFVLSTEPGASSIIQTRDRGAAGERVLFIGPEGGWTAAEMDAFRAAHIQPVRLTDTVLRIETAAIAAAAVMLLHYSNPNRACTPD
jgi:16S rRNA (uracil1498-N3)-methyltransferase